MMNWIKRKLSSLQFRLLYKKAQIRDWIYGVDLTSPVSREAAGIDQVGNSECYMSTEFAPELGMALRFSGIDGKDAIVDFGSGKGAALVRFSKFPFRRICGVELSPMLAEISRKNMRKLKLDKVEIVESDATAFTELDDFNIFYLANPFSGHPFDTVMRNIINSFDRKRRMVTLIYYHPKCHQLVMQTGRFEVVKEIIKGARKIIIYKCT